MAETIADIVAEKRRRAEDIRNNLSTVPVRRLDQESEIKSLEDEADRIEAAHDHDIATATEACARAVVGACVKQEEVKRESDEMLDALVRIGNWCAQDLAENTYISDSSGNYLKTLNGLCNVCRPFMQKAIKLKRYGGAKGGAK